MAWLSRLRVASPIAKSTTRARLLATCRSFGSAAAVELDFDYDSDEEYFYREPRLGLAASEPLRGVQWVLMGAPGAWRHAYAERLSKLLEVPHISMGSLVRQELNPRSSLYKEIASAINEGKLVPEDVVFALLSKRLEEGYYNGETGFILDGIPRSRIQAEILDQIADIDLVVNLKCSEEHLVKRSSVSETSPRKEFLGSRLPSAVPINTWKESLRVHAEEVKPLEEYYGKQRKLLDFHVSGGTPGESWQGLLAALHLKHRNAASNTWSPKLTM